MVLAFLAKCIIDSLAVLSSRTIGASSGPEVFRDPALLRIEVRALPFVIVDCVPIVRFYDVESVVIHGLAFLVWV